MGKVAGGPEMKRKKTKKKGRPSLLDLRMRSLSNNNTISINYNNNNNNNNNNSPISKSVPFSTPDLRRRSTRRNPNFDTPDSDSDDDERREKKIKLVVRLPTSNSTSHASDSDRSDAVDHAPVVKAEKVTEALQGSPLESGPTGPLPDKKLLLFILDRLQKKDTYGVFSEPVDPNELPDYNEIIEHPMDFGTVRKKLNEGSYANLDDFESDVLLICANGMQYNGSDSVYFRQAKSIQEIAKRDFQNLRQVNEEGEPQPRIVRRGRPPNLKKAFSTPTLDRIGPESSSDATLATAGDNNNNIIINNNNNNNSAIGSNSYNLRKGLPSFRFQSTDGLFKASPQSRNNETYGADYTTDWNSEFPAKILKAEAKYGKKHFFSDENRRSTYKQFHSSSSGHDSSSLTTLNGNMKQLIGVGLYSEHGYARSLARFAANLGPVVWKIASKKIENALPNGVNFGPGWVGENEALKPPQPQPSLLLPINNLVDENNNKSHNRNDFNHLPRHEFSSQTDILRERLNLLTGEQQQSCFQDANPTALNHTQPNIDVSNIIKNPQNILLQQHRPFNGVIPIPPDLNVRFQAPVSPNSSFQIGSPQPDLALQL